MFDSTNIDYIKRVINSRESCEYIIPLYVRIFNKTFGILELDDIDNYDSSTFKIGFGSSISILSRNSFISKFIYEFNFIQRFNEYNYEENCDTAYIIFESGYVDDSSVMHEQINQYVDILSNKVKEVYDNNRITAIEE